MIRTAPRRTAECSTAGQRWNESVQTQTLSAPMDGDGELIRSRQVSAETLQAKVFAARNALHMTITALASRTGMSPRTIRDIEEGADRSYRSTTLAPLDAVFGWEAGEAYRTWRAEVGERPDPSDNALIAAQMAEIVERVRRIEEQPPWTTEMLDACRLLTAEQRALVLAIARELSRGS